jgi:hypothetical protein
MIEPSLGGLDVDAPEKESGGISPAEVVKLSPLDLCLLSGRVPDPVKPVRIVEVFPVRCGEAVAVSVSGVESAKLEVVCEESNESGWCGQVPAGGLRLGRPYDRAPCGASRDCSAMVMVDRSKSIRPTRRRAQV